MGKESAREGNGERKKKFINRLRQRENRDEKEGQSEIWISCKKEKKMRLI